MDILSYLSGRPELSTYQVKASQARVNKCRGPSEECAQHLLWSHLPRLAFILAPLPARLSSGVESGSLSLTSGSVQLLSIGSSAAQGSLGYPVLSYFI